MMKYKKLNELELKKYIKACEEQGWIVHDISKNEIELENWSPAGENLIYYFNKKNFIEEFENFVETFDPDEHAEDWVIARRNRNVKGIPNIQCLVWDAQKIDSMLWDLLCELKRVS